MCEKNSTDKKILMELKNLRVSYKNRVAPVIAGVDLSLQSGELTALLGLNGSGKSTLMKAACGLLPFKAEQFFVCGTELSGKNKKNLASDIAYISQKPSIMYHIDTLDVVLMGVNPHLKLYQTPSEAQRKYAAEVLVYIGLEGSMYQDFLFLSEGQKQLAILARALMQNSPIMMFDEPDSALDYENRRRILGMISRIIKERQYAGLITLHDPDYALRYCDKILLLQNGTIQDTIICKDTDLQTAEQKLRKIYPEIKLIECETGFLTMK